VTFLKTKTKNTEK